MSDVPYRVPKPWGYEIVWAHTDRYVGKILHIEAGHALSLQYHKLKDESIYVLLGAITLRIKENDVTRERQLEEGEGFHVTPGMVHQFEAIRDTDLLEASTPHIDDVVRLQDRYGRA